MGVTHEVCRDVRLTADGPVLADGDQRLVRRREALARRGRRGELKRQVVVHLKQIRVRVCRLRVACSSAEGKDLELTEDGADELNLDVGLGLVTVSRGHRPVVTQAFAAERPHATARTEASAKRIASTSSTPGLELARGLY